MFKNRNKIVLTEKEEEIMKLLWEHGPMFVRQMVEYYNEPKPHVNTVSTLVRILEQKGYVGHEAVGGSHRYHAIARMEDFRRKTFGELIRNYFGNSYMGAVSALVEEEKISVDELKKLIEQVEKGRKEV
ncbi:MAG: BlaI/MecI/CopY family transcriptional regulator [Bacteroides sp.]|nr:BlaI/MecI/CopY family transcriptional regulator [Barnesiella sp.]MBD5256697.1 BlaI/MecI/CopY family transcriptional regulator [Bacteroides sp.]MDE5821397.1 BlaI/MecI/CopY family transcriptional regulator [Paramuribaculum sp.]MDE5836317.1 BlaI/MecI/CopY family transcriptional regulator [Paramuribaculum sp.]